ncbi:MAG: sugar transferase [Candidatus Omnitrophica bacterium]|nr:sugar transferase [Candidatus Omnitrophota bacterium]
MDNPIRDLGMLREYDRAFRQLLIFIDLTLISLAFLSAYFLRSYLGIILDKTIIKPQYPLEHYLTVLPTVLILWGTSLYLTRAYIDLRRRSLWIMLYEIFKANLLATFVFGSIAYLLKLYYISRVFLGSFSVLALIFICLERTAIITTLRYFRKKGFNTRYVLLVGTGKRAQSFIRLVQRHPEWGFKIIGLLDMDPKLVGKRVLGHKIIGKLTDIPTILDQRIVDEVIFVVPRTWLANIELAILYCEQVGKRVSIAIDLFTLQFARAQQTGLPGFPLLMFQSTTDKHISLFIKRFLDIAISLTLLMILSPVFFVTAMIIKFNSSDGPVVFKQVRVGLNGRLFTLYKFRTMVLNAENLLESLRKYNEMTGPVFKMSNDPRLIKFGRFIRKFSLDEFPQLVNVLRGDMSIVGPRPPIPAEIKKYEPWQRRRLSMRPGLTCLWQVQGRNKIIKFDEWMKLDLQYIDNWSLALDLKIFVQTIPIVLLGIGAK